MHRLRGTWRSTDADGSAFFIDVDALRTNANHHMITQGLVYPTYYRGPFPDLRNELTAVAKQAHDSGLGVWAGDETTTGADVTGLAALQDDVAILPKLVRRLGDYLHLGDHSMAGFPAFLDPGRRQVLRAVHRPLDPPG